MVYRERRPDGTTRLTGAGGSGTPGPPGEPGPEGPEGTRWGTTTAWHFADHTDVPCSMADGGEPRVGDMLVCINPIGPGEIYTITAVYPTTNNVDFDYEGSIRGPVGPDGATGEIPDMSATSTDSETFGTGSKTFDFTSAINQEWPVGTPVTVYNSMNPTMFMEGRVTSSSVASATINVESFAGIGAISTWVLVVSGKRGPQGPQGDAGPAGGVLDAWPVGAVYISVLSTSPATLFGGTWSRISQGRVLVGQDSSDTDWDVAEETRGSKTTAMPDHTHDVPAHNHGLGAATSSGVPSGSGGGQRLTGGNTDNKAAFATTNPNSNPAISVVQPSFVVYIWKRTA